MTSSYKTTLWHNPNCRAWHRNRKTNKPFKYLVEMFPDDDYKCTCGYDKDYEKIQAFIKGKDYHDKNLPFYRGQLVYIKPIKDSALDSDCLAIICETMNGRYSVLVLDKNGNYGGGWLQAWVNKEDLEFRKNPTKQYIEWLEKAEESDDKDFDEEDDE